MSIRMYLLFATLSTASLLTSPLPAGAQAKASCKFQRFLLNSSNPNNPRVNVSGVNDNRAVVGSAQYPNNKPDFKPFLRRPNSKITYFLPDGAIYGEFTDRNNAGVTVGNYVDSSQRGHAFMWRNSKVIQIGVPKSYPHSTYAYGINKFDTVVGSYSDFSGKMHAFKRTSDGRYLRLTFPESTFTEARGINDNGAIVGNYGTPNSQLSHGFIYYHGSWATLNYKHTTSSNTDLVGISNSGVIGGNDYGTGFIYESGVFKVVSAAKSSETTVQGISADGIIAGNLQAGNPYGYTAKCQ
jgi:hypothetical protein